MVPSPASNLAPWYTLATFLLAHGETIDRFLDQFVRWFMTLSQEERLAFLHACSCPARPEAPEAEPMSYESPGGPDL